MIPLITWAGYSIGRKVLGDQYPALGWESFKHFSWKDFSEFFYVLTIGSTILGVLLSVLFYFVTLWLFQRREKSV